jgi:hypothetical protein
MEGDIPARTLPTAVKAIVILFIIAVAGLLAWAWAEENLAGCVSCLPYSGTMQQEGSDLVLTVYYTHCPGSTCYRCGAGPADLRSLNVTITYADGRQQVRYENRSVRAFERIVVPGVMTDNKMDKVLAVVSYNGFRNESCSLVVQDGYL